MENMEDSRISAILEKIGKIQSDLHALEEQVKALATSVAAPVPPADEVAGKHGADDQSPIDLSIADIDIPVASAVEPAESAVGPVEPVVELVESAVGLVEPAEPTVEPAESAELVEAAGEAIAGPVAEPAAGMAGVPVREEPVAEDLPEDIPVPDAGALEPPVEKPAVPVHEGTEQKKKAPAKAIMDSVKADHAVMDVMAEKQAWKLDRPGSAVKNIISAISLNDRVLLINVLFREDPMLFQETISKFNDMGSLGEAVAYIAAHFPDWDMNSEPVYRLMMAVRRKLS